MFRTKLSEKIKDIRSSVVAIGFKTSDDKFAISGSGFCVGNSGQILTAAHLYNKTKDEFRNKLIAGVLEKIDQWGIEHYKWLPVSFVSKDDKNDIAILQVDGYEKTLLHPVVVGDSERVDVGDDVYFLGFPYPGELIKDGFGITLVLSKAVISNIKRDGIDTNHPRNFILLDTISNPGNSGGPLFDVYSNTVIGVMSITFRTQSRVQPTLDIREPMNLCAARPINLVKKIIN